MIRECRRRNAGCVWVDRVAANAASTFVTQETTNRSQARAITHTVSCTRLGTKRYRLPSFVREYATSTVAAYHGKTTARRQQVDGKTTARRRQDRVMLVADSQWIHRFKSVQLNIIRDVRAFELPFPAYSEGYTFPSTGRSEV